MLKFWGAPTGVLLRNSTSTTGFVAESVRDKNESSIRVLRNGTSVETTFGEDPRLGMLSPVPERVVVTTPGGLSRVSGQTRDVSLDAFGNLSQQMDVTTVNGESFIQLHDLTTRRISTSTPEGRNTTTILNALNQVSEIERPGYFPVSYGYLPTGHLVWRFQ